ncbi:LysE family translocator [Desulfoferrobacter suflitae]|uniref:LysE family translocator n=1 Tax=Desulfoferrobacter suflitae TaxID=2865782 RepID=UPI002164D89D|nr:LysE family translocator [Desulfoferrobacter suflitae]MCK8602961.1 LysE family translocator [Desulfoferrobacter suflitae]
MFEMAAIVGASFTLALSGALMPGPLLTITISESARRGFPAGPLLMVGHALLELLLVVAVIQGLGSYLRRPTVIGCIALMGGLLLLYLGVDMVRSAGKLSLREEMQGTSPGYSRHPVLLGVLASISNPYWTLWWATIGLGYLVTAMEFGYAGVAAFFVGHIAADFAWYSLVSLGISRGKTFLPDSGYRHIIRFCGVFLFFFGGWFLLSAKEYLGPSLF